MKLAWNIIAIAVIWSCVPAALGAAQALGEPDPRVSAAEWARHSHLGTAEEAYPEVKSTLGARGASFADFKKIHDQQKPLDITFNRMEVASEGDLATAPRAIVNAVVRIQYLGDLAKSLRQKANTDILVSKTIYCMERQGSRWIGVKRAYPEEVDGFLPKPRKEVGAGPIRVSLLGPDLRVEKLADFPQVKSTLAVIGERRKAEGAAKRAGSAAIVASAVLLVAGGLVLLWRWRSHLQRQEESVR